MKVKLMIAVCATLANFFCYASEPTNLQWQGIVPPPQPETHFDTRYLKVDDNQQPIVKTKFVVKAINIGNKKETISIVQPLI